MSKPIFKASFMAKLAAGFLLVSALIAPALAGEGGGGARLDGAVKTRPAKTDPVELAWPKKINVPVNYEDVFFPGPMPGSKSRDR
ncbi:MAG: hypothetical protein AAGL23_14440 [Pseudomonadota bacterium]